MSQKSGWWPLSSVYCKIALQYWVVIAKYDRSTKAVEMPLEMNGRFQTFTLEV
ncbi:hypothetical protein [Acaryochloris marina]|uniref:hypothetical protein n=1 Tax=Acaryochloris marina TaxID=155978 RepID=UPI00164F655E|nr:hypothetical protein [Acaryochloris marina]